MRGRKGPMDINSKTIPQLQNTLWPIFALYIKKNHSVDGVHCKCFTCDKALKIGDRDCQAGHWIPRTYSPVKYEEDNLRPQCSQCNEFWHGRPVEFERRLRLEIGDERVGELKTLATQSWKWDRTWLKDQIACYKEQLRDYE